ncbi:MAG: chitobiase/beta-hexosaminidase C-terminal domain-containing protein [Bacteroidales bacterium]|nr:chitobiase/beta-hexosaminidase C-terminal domain-containing protein [Bacteroidales bacterium]
MKRNSTLLWGSLLLLLLWAIPGPILLAQRNVYEENFGNPTANTLVQNYLDWQDHNVTYTGDGTCDIRSSNASQGYGPASGGGNVMINDTIKWFMVSGINTSGLTDLSIYCGLRKTTAENGNNFKVEVSQDGRSWTRLFLSDTLPTGTGTSGWYRVRYPNVPACGNLHIRFSNSALTDYRLDDIALVSGEEVTLATVETPLFSPAGGTYYEPQSVSITTNTPDASIYYTLDNSTPTTQSTPYSGPFTLNRSGTIKAIATCNNMYNSEIAAATFTILDTNSLVTLPLDISDNSTVTHYDITGLDGFRGYHLGTSYSDGSVKFESSHAGEASLVAHLDSSPDTIVFELKGKKGGSNPSAYEGVRFQVSYSEDGTNWTPFATIFGDDISVEEFTRFEYTIANGDARYVRWTLQSALKGNTQLNNLRITQNQGQNSGGSGITNNYDTRIFEVYPNPNSGGFTIHKGNLEIRSLTLYNILGHAVKSWDNPVEGTYYFIYQFPKGTYILKAVTNHGTIQRKVVLQ